MSLIGSHFNGRESRLRSEKLGNLKGQEPEKQETPSCREDSFGSEVCEPTSEDIIYPLKGAPINQRKMCHLLPQLISRLKM